MSSSGVNYYLRNYASFDYENHWKIWFDFKNVSVSSGIINRSGANSLYNGNIYTSPSVSSGEMFSVNDFLLTTTGGSGSVNISPSTGIWSDDFSLIFLNKKESLGKTLIFNCLETGNLNGENVYKGYRIGYTDTNKPFFEYYTDKGLECLVADFNLSTSHSLNFIKTYDSLSIGVYNPLTQKNSSQSFNINSSFLFEPSGGYRLGYSSSNISDTTFPISQSLSGKVYIDEFLYFDLPLYDYDIQVINSGFISDYVESITGSGVLLTTGITGYQTGVVSIFSGVTGVQINPTGLITNEFGVTYTGNTVEYLYQNITGLGVTPLTGVVSTVYNFLTDGNIVINTGYLKEFYNSGVCFLKKMDGLDVTELVAETGKLDSINNSQIGVYDVVQKQFRVFDNNLSSLFLNGQLVISGDISNSGTIYDPIWVLSQDYFVTGNYINSLTGYNSRDLLTTLNVEQTVKYSNNNFYYTGGTPYVVSNSVNNNSFIYFNGLKLGSGSYQFSGNDLVFSNSLLQGATGILVILDITGSFSQNSGFFPINIMKNNPYYSHIYQNGQKLTKEIDYINISTYSYLNGSGIFEYGTSSIYNDFDIDDLFWS